MESYRPVAFRGFLGQIMDRQIGILWFSCVMRIVKPLLGAPISYILVFIGGIFPTRKIAISN